MNKLKAIAPSTDPVSKENLIDYAKNLQCVGADFLHCDCMDGRFVSRLTLDENDVELLKKFCVLPLDVHLMIENPIKKIKNYAKAKANIITIHYEALKEKKVLNALKRIKKYGCLAGLSINPATPLEKIIKFIPMCDLVLLMSVVPGKSGQNFHEEIYDKLIALQKLKENFNNNLLIEIDGGITPNISKKLFSLGANILISGNYIFSAPDKALAINSLKK